MGIPLRHPGLSLLCFLFVLGSTTQLASSAEHKPAASIPAADLVQPAALAARLKSGSAASMLILQVGFHSLYIQGHIPGSVYAGPAGQPAGLAALRAAVQNHAKDAPVLLYCGCCPWDKCPNIAAAYDELKAMGFTAIQVLYIAHDFGTDWVEKGYPSASS